MTEPEIAPLILSASSIQWYLTCHYRYYLKAVLRVPDPPSMEAVIGRVVHAGAEAIIRNDPVGPEDALRASFEREVASVATGEEITPEEAFADSQRLLAMWSKHIRPTLGEPTLIESNFAIRVDGTLVSGQIDFADDSVHDTKTTTTLSKFRPDGYRLQLTIYRHGFRALLGQWPKRLILDVLARNGRWKQVEIEPDDHELGNAVGVASRGIMEGRFEPTGATSGVCSWCPYSGGRCPYAVVE